jgi:hypothetical protein
MSAIAVLSGDKQTSGEQVEIDAIDPTRTSAGEKAEYSNCIRHANLDH